MSKTITVSRFLPVFQSSSKTRVSSELVVVSGSSTNVYAYVPKTKKKYWRMDIAMFFNRKVLALSLVSINTVLVFSYLVGTNSYSSKGYEIKRIQKSISGLKEQNKKLVLQAAEINSIVKMQEMATLDGFVPVTNTEFVAIPKFSQR